MGIYMSVTLLRMRRIIIIITCTCNGSPWFSWYTAKVYVLLRTTYYYVLRPTTYYVLRTTTYCALVAMVLREASALMRISSNIP